MVGPSSSWLAGCSLLFELIATMVVLGPEASSEYFDINGTIQSSNTSAYLNVGSSSDSYIPVTFGSTATTTAWALEGDTITTATGSTWGRREFYFVYFSYTATFTWSFPVVANPVCSLLQ